MAILDIVKYPDPRLRKVSEPVKSVNEEKIGRAHV